MSDTRSGDYTWNPSEYAIITGALRLLSAIQSAETPPAEEYEDARAALNGVVHAWQANQIHVWTQTTYTIPLIASKAQYRIGIGAPDVGTQPRPLRISNGRLVLGQVETPLIEMSRLDYANLSGKTLPTGPPTQWFYDPQVPFGILTLDPAPDITTVANGGTVVLVGLRPMQSFDTQRNTADVPQEWISALRFALAVELAPEYDCPKDRFEIIKTLADEKLNIVKGWDIEQQGTSPLPYSQQVFQLISGALRLAGGCGAQEIPKLGVINNGFYALNAMVQAWQGKNIRVWAETDATLFLQPGQADYSIGPGSPDHCCLSKGWTQTALTATAVTGATALSVASISSINAGDHIGVWLDAGSLFWTTVLSASGTTVNLVGAMPSQATAGALVVDYTTDLIRPLKMPAARRYIFGNPAGGTPVAIEIPLGIMSRIDYANIPTKRVPNSVPVQIFFEPTLSAATVHIWPPMSAGNFNAVKMTVQMPLTTFPDLTQITNFPAEWNAALRFNLALELWSEHAERRAALKGDWNVQLLSAQAQEKLLDAQAWDREPESVYFGLSSYPATRN